METKELKVTPWEREFIMRDSEQGARHSAQKLGTLKKVEGGNGYVPMTASEIAARTEERVERAREYAVWRIKSYEAGECASPW